MTRPWQRALWGYRINAVTRVVDSLELQLVQRRDQRTAELAQLKNSLAERQTQLQNVEDALKQSQAEYFTLSGELNALLMMAQQRLEEAQAALEHQESLARAQLENRRHYADHLAKTVRDIPDHVSQVIETITTAIQGMPEELRHTEKLPSNQTILPTHELPNASSHD